MSITNTDQIDRILQQFIIGGYHPFHKPNVYLMNGKAYIILRDSILVEDYLTYAANHWN